MSSQHRHSVIENATSGKYEPVNELKITSIDTRLDETIGAINNLSDLGSGSNTLKSATLGVMPSGNARILSCSTEGYLNVDLQAGTLNVGDVDVVSLPQVQDNILTKITSVDTRFDNTISAVNNLSNLGAGSNLLKSASVGIMSGGNARILSCSDSGSLNVNLASGAITGFSTSAKQDTVISHIDGLESKLDTIDGSINTLEACVGSNKLNVNISSGGFDGTVSGTVTANLSATDNSVLDSIATDGDNIQTLLTQIDVVADNSLTKLTEIDTAIDTIDTVLDNILVQNTASEVRLSSIDSLARTSIATGSASLDDNEAVGAEDVSKFAEICVMYATSATHSGKSLTLQGATTSGGTYYNFAMLTRITLQPDDSSTDHIAYIWGTGNSNTNAEFIPAPYSFIKVINQTGKVFGDSDSIRIVGR